MYTTDLKKSLFVTDKTFLDGLYAHIAKDSNTDEKELFDLKQFIKKHEYDTESVTEDINNDTDSNLFTYFATKLVELTAHFIKYNKCMFLFCVFVTFNVLFTKQNI